MTPARAPAVPAAARGRARADTSGPVTLTDPRNAVAVDENGVTVRVAEVEADFAWEEIAQVIPAVSGLGRTFHVLVRLRDGEELSVRLRAPDRRTREEWLSRLGRVVDRYLDEWPDPNRRGGLRR
ncbi:hypothetical protein ACFV6E_04535 [Streptomyces sp. NPDC059785]|uniref:hypothetical protein n=1 Tax=Streptomyces sp. NPDC059785 TaxID=3346945 RepID=UPI003663AF96